MATKGLKTLKKEAEEAKRMKNPLYRVKKTVKDFMKNRKPDDDGSHESR